MKCRNCGAEIGNSKFCEFCGTQITYDMRREQEQVNKQGCPQCGSSNIQFSRENQGEIHGKKSKQVFYRTVGFCKDCGYTWYPGGSNDAPQKNNLIWWILGWIFFFPAPVMVLIWRKKNTWDIKIKIVVTAVFWVLIFALGSSRNSSDSSSKNISTTIVEETTNYENTESTNADDKSNDIAVEQAKNEESTKESGYAAIDNCYEELSANNNAKDWDELSKQIKELADKYGLYQDVKNNGLGVRYAKIATTRDEAKVVYNGDLAKGTYYITIVADFSKGRPDIHLVDNTGSNTEQSTESKNNVEGTFENLEIIYELNDGINRYINHFNVANPDSPITSEMAQPYHHHGRDHEDQIKYIDDKFEIVITRGVEVYIGYMPSTAHSNDEYKEMYKKYLKGFNLGLSDSDMDADWESIMNAMTHSVKFNSYSANVFMSMDKISYVTITKK